MSLTRDRLLTSAPAEAMSKWIIASLNLARQRASSSSGVRESELELEGSWVRSSPGAHKKMSHSPRCYLLVIHLLIYFCFTFISHSIIIPSNFISRNWTEERSATPGGYSSKFYVLYGQAPLPFYIRLLTEKPHLSYTYYLKLLKDLLKGQLSGKLPLFFKFSMVS